MGSWSDISAATSARAVTPHDTTLQAGGTCRSLYIGTTGDLSVLMADGTTGEFANVPVGIFPIQAQRVNSTGTTATDIVALY